MFVIMPNHIYGIVMILDPDVSAGYADAISMKQQPKAGTLSVVIGSSKSAVTRKIHTLAGHSNQTVWQSCFHDHIIRDEHSLNILRQYVLSNPACWNKDMFFGG